MGQNSLHKNAAIYDCILKITWVNFYVIAFFFSRLEY